MKKSGKNYAINDRIGGEKMPVEGTETPRSFAEGTGIRKYAKNDPSVAPMRARRAKFSREHGVGVPGSGGLALMASEMARQARRPASVKKVSKIPKASKKVKAAKRTRIFDDSSRNQELQAKMRQRHEEERKQISDRIRERRANIERSKMANRAHINGIRGLDQIR